jgi:hypothetical protein
MQFMFDEHETYDYPNSIFVSSRIASIYKDILYSKIEHLYHYTNLDGLLGILENKCLWATQINFMNDTQEYQHGIETSLQTINERVVNTTHIDELAFLKGLEKHITCERGELFVVSFCEEGDLLSQWRGYSRGDIGIAIGFNYKELSTEFNTQFINNFIIPFKVIYDVKIQKQMVSDIIDIGIKALHYGNGTFPRKARIEHFPELIAETILSFVPLFKHPSFSKEKEHRFIYGVDKERKNVNFRVRNNMILPYSSIDLVRINDTCRQMPIDKIIIGPFNGQELTRQSIDYFLTNNNYNYIHSEFSSIPFR